MPDPRRSEEIRRRIADERDGLAHAVSDLRDDVREKAQKIPAVLGGAAALGVAFAAARAAVRRRRR